MKKFLFLSLIIFSNNLLNSSSIIASYDSKEECEKNCKKPDWCGSIQWVDNGPISHYCYRGYEE